MRSIEEAVLPKKADRYIGDSLETTPGSNEHSIYGFFDRTRDSSRAKQNMGDIYPKARYVQQKQWVTDAYISLH